MNPLLWVVAVIGALAGGLSTIYLTVSFPAVIVWKLYRRIAKGIPIGGDIEYADEVTLIKALENRIEF